MAKACTFIGNRDLSLNEQWALRPRLQQAIMNYLNAGGYFFACGGSYGFDLVAAEEVLNFKQYYPYIQMILLLPYPHYTSRWTMEDQQRLQQVMQYSIYRYSYSAYRKGIYSERNQQLIDGSNYCIYYSDSKTAPYTQSIIDYAIDNGIWTTNLADNLLWGADDYFEHL